MNILIIGGTGYVGEYVFNKYRALGDNVRAASRRPAEGQIQFDIRSGDPSFLSGLFPKGEEKHAILCAAETNLNRCGACREEAYDINVTSTKRLLSALKEYHYHVIFCSTDCVFSGAQGNYVETDEAGPINEYGKMKAEIERYIQDHFPEACVARLSKVIGRPDQKKDMLTEWKDMALGGKEIFCIRGNYFSPVYVDDVANCFRIILERGLSGLYHICGNERYARVELCRKFLRGIGINAAVSEKELKDFSFAEARPLDTSMSSEKFHQVTGYRFSKLEDIFALYSDSLENVL